MPACLPSTVLQALRFILEGEELPPESRPAKPQRRQQLLFG